MWEFQVALEMDLVHIFQHIYVLWLHRPIINNRNIGYDYIATHRFSLFVSENMYGLVISHQQSFLELLIDARHCAMVGTKRFRIMIVPLRNLLSG